MTLLADVFNSNIFESRTLTAAIELLPAAPGRIGQMGLFQPAPVGTTTLVVEERQGVLRLLPSKKRGAPANLHDTEKRKARAFVIPHIPYEDQVLADDILNVRQFGSNELIPGVSTVVNDKLVSMKQDFEVTEEFLKIGAVKGIIIDGDGATTLYNLFTEFELEQTTVDFAMNDPETSIRLKCLAVKRAIESALGATPYATVHCLCGQTFFEQLISHPDVAAAYERWNQGEMLRNDPRKGFAFADIVFEEYVGNVSGTAFIGTNDAHFFPVGVPGLFKIHYAPGNFTEAVGTLGKRLYALSENLPLDAGRRLHVQSNPLPMCMRPGVLVKSTYVP